MAPRPGHRRRPVHGAAQPRLRRVPRPATCPAALARWSRPPQLDVEVSRGISLARPRPGAGRGGPDPRGRRDAGPGGGDLRADRLAQDLGEAEVARAECALLAGDVAAARRFAGRARDRFRRRGNDAVAAHRRAGPAAGRPRRRAPGAPPGPVALRLAAELRADGCAPRARVAALVAAEALLPAARSTRRARSRGRSGTTAASDPITVAAARPLRARAARRSPRGRPPPRPGARSGRAWTSWRLPGQLRWHRPADRQRGARPAAGRARSRAWRSASGRPAAVLAAAERGRAVSSRLPAVTAAGRRATRPSCSPNCGRSSSRSAAEPATTAELARSRRRELERQIKARAWTLRRRRCGAERPASVGRDPRPAIDAADASAGRLRRRSAARLHAVVVGRPAAPGCVELGPPRRSTSSSGGPRRPRRPRPTTACPRVCGPPRRLAARSLAQLDAALLGPLGLSAERGWSSSRPASLGALPWGAAALAARGAGGGRPVGDGLARRRRRADRPTARPACGRRLAGPELRPGGGRGRGGRRGCGYRAERPVGCVTGAEADRRAGRRVGRAESCTSPRTAAPDGEPAVLLAAAGRRPVVRPRARRSTAAARRAVGLRARPGDRPAGRRGARADQRAAAPGHPQRGRRRGPGRRRRGRRGDDRLPPARWPAGAPRTEALAEAVARPATSPAPFVCFGAAWRTAA